MNSYVELDGFKYQCPFKQWETITEKPVSVRYTWGSRPDVTFGNGVFVTWTGSLRAEVTPQEGYGGVSDIKNSLKKQTTLTFKDHYGGVVYQVAVEMISPERSVSPRWDSPSNAIFFPVRITMISDGGGQL